MCMCWRGVGGVKVCVVAKLSVSENIREFLYNVFRVSSCGFTIFRMFDCFSKCAYM